MSSYLQATALGYLGGDAETRYAKSGTMIVNFSMACTRKRQDEEITTWVRVATFGKLAESLDSLAQDGALKKGSQVLVMGEMTRTEWTDKEGFLRDSLEINAQVVRLTGSRGDSSSNTPGGQRRKAPDAPANAPVDIDEVSF